MSIKRDWSARAEKTMPGYYSEKLSAARLKRCYEIAPPRVQQYLEAEICFVCDLSEPMMDVLELGCGYGRVLSRLVGRAKRVVGIDTSVASLDLARKSIGADSTLHLAAMDAAALAFGEESFDKVVCIQNGISAFAVERSRLIAEAVRVTRPGGRALFSSYAESFWSDRIDWFRIQAAEGLLGEIVEEASGDGVIVCSDGFHATTVDPEEFACLTKDLDASVRMVEVDGSSLFCVIEKD